ncbi:MAG: DUF354 domain-containing protein [Thermoproteus sp.]
MKVLFDALTPKQARIASILKKSGLNLVITCREYYHVKDMLDHYGVEYTCIGRYGETVEEKLTEGLRRQMALVDIIKGLDGVLSFPSPDAVRVAFGLGKKSIVLNDTPHAYHANSLTIPLSEYLIAPAAIPVEAWRPYCPKRVEVFDGLFEYMWTSRHKPNRDVITRLGLEPGRYVVFRPEEAKAAYYKWNYVELRRKLMETVRELGYVVVNVPRYDDQIVEGAVNLTKAVDHLDLAYYAAAVITGGLTMATEAALLGTPALSYFPEELYVDTYLISKGAPLRRCRDFESCLKELKRALDEGRTPPLRLEDPTGLILEIAEKAF